MKTRRNIEPIWVARTAEWHVTFDRQTQDYAAFIDGDQLVLVGFYRSQSAAEQACREYTFESACAGWGCVDSCGDCAIAA